MGEVINLNADRKHEIIHYFSLGFSVKEIAMFFEMQESLVSKFLDDHFNNNPTPPRIA